MEQIKNTGLVVNFDGNRVIKTIPAVDIVRNSITVIRFTDFPIEKKVVAYCTDLIGELVLWEGEAYDTIGDWTNQDAIDRIKELYPTEP